MKLSINQFSDLTGISKSTLRFYDDKGLLCPQERLNNGYRVYTLGQMSDAKLINSLRQAGISLSDISGFLESDCDRQESIIEAWREETERKLLTIKLAKQYLNQFRPEYNDLHLLNWSEPKTFIWIRDKIPAASELPFKEKVNEHRFSLEKLGVNVVSHGYALIHDLENEWLLGEVGFEIASQNSVMKIDFNNMDLRIESMQPMMWVSLTSHKSLKHSCQRVFSFISKNGFIPAGSRIQRYYDHLDDYYELMIPIVKKD
ncbi:MerR family transcriptional regulator [Paenibacillus sp. PR3]|uniref:MerR family transcriptional regulator n=1 Tax=Paenibacillus terricola TaxID=2763503 RepID=A0ABR8MQX7_9BACL|nr:MerR family transcriptional regulator [Paenibacillus terricola]MBD3918395.1 MerR family transcriptional regulator [Paenibacillus terricola]